MSNKKAEPVTPRDLYIRLIQTVGDYLEGRMDEDELEDAYDAVMADPLLVTYATGNYDRVSLVIPRGHLITIIGPDPVER